jgi:hypothetical protein
VKLKCGVHAERESENRPIFVCHHCGMPVCEEHGWVIVVDDAFDDVEGPVSRSAMHCPECTAEYHPRGVSKRHGWVVIRPRAAADQEALATTQPEPPLPGYGPAVPRPQVTPYRQPQVPYPPPRYPQQPPRAPGPVRGGP